MQYRHIYIIYTKPLNDGDFVISFFKVMPPLEMSPYYPVRTAKNTCGLFQLLSLIFVVILHLFHNRMWMLKAFPYAILFRSQYLLFSIMVILSFSQQLFPTCEPWQYTFVCKTSDTGLVSLYVEAFGNLFRCSNTSKLPSFLG